MTEDRDAMLAALAWQVELGADEAIAETPQDRFEQSKPKTPSPQPSPVEGEGAQVSQPAQHRTGTRPAQPAASPPPTTG